MDHMRFNASYKAMQVTSMQRRHARQVQHTSARPQSGCSLVLRQHAGLVPRDAVGLLKHGAALDCSATALLDQPPENRHAPCFCLKCAPAVSCRTILLLIFLCSLTQSCLQTSAAAAGETASCPAWALRRGRTARSLSAWQWSAWTARSSGQHNRASLAAHALMPTSSFTGSVCA